MKLTLAQDLLYLRHFWHRSWARSNLPPCWINP